MSALFWIAAALFTGATLTLASRPLWKGAGAAPPVAAHEVAVYKSQLAELDRDLARGALSEQEAEGARREIARRLLAADAALSRQAAFDPAPEETSKRTLLMVFAPMALLALALYAILGAPARPGAPFASRDVASERAAALLPQAEAQRRAREAGLPAPQEPDKDIAELIARMEKAVKSRPKDPEGRVLLARAYLGLQRAAEAWPLFGRAAELMGEKAPPQLFAQMGEAMMLAAGGYVSREAEQIFARAPNQSISRYMLGVADAQRGDHRGALARWTPLYAEQKDAPFAPALLGQIRRAAEASGLDADALAARLGAPASDAAAAQADGAKNPPGPDEDQIRAAANMTETERAEMIEGMVAGLAEKLESDPKDLPGWLRLLRAYAVLGRKDEAAAALKSARAAFEGDSEALARLEAAEKALAGGTKP